MKPILSDSSDRQHVINMIPEERGKSIEKRKDGNILDHHI